MKADLHCHSIYSDGTLSPEEVVDLAFENEVEMLALTDHDSIQGLNAARVRCKTHGINMVDGVEISVTWNSHTIHIVGLNIDVKHSAIVQILTQNAEFREQRTQAIIDKLASLDLDVSTYLEKVIPENGLITRTHLARALVAIGAVNNMDKSFKKYLGKGKPAYIEGDWVSLENAIAAINASGGVAVIAHPMRYRLGATRLDSLVNDFAAAGGKALEVVTATQDVNQQARCVQLTKQYNLHASIGSDFHSLDQPWAIIGRCPELPSTVTPIWECWT